jgi:beta-lactamase regulating signal transducer with metallopeptidase domain
MIILTYLSKMVLCSGVLFGYYWLFLRNRRFHHYNRFYLLATLALSLVLPLIKIPVFNDESSTLSQVIYKTAGFTMPEIQPGQQILTTLPVPEQASWFTLPHLAWLAYTAVLLWLLAFFVRSLLYIRHLSKHYSYELVRDLKLYQTQEPGTPFSFFRAVFWNDQLALNSPEGQQIFRHELFHVQQKHSADVILTELVSIAGWFNPFFHLIKKELKAIHEFLADQYASSGNDRYAYAELLVQRMINNKRIDLTHPFFQNHIKRRIAMIIKHNKQRYNYCSRLMVLPVSLLLFLAISVYAGESKHSINVQAPAKTIAESVAPADTGKPAKAVPAATHPVKQAPAKITAALSYLPEENLDLEKVRSLGNKVTDMKEVPGLFGVPQQKVLATNNGFWTYDTRKSHLRIEFDKETDKITSYSFTANQDKPTDAISYEDARAIKINSTTSEAIHKQFGEPFAIVISPEKEVWEYSNPAAQMHLVFDATDSNNKVVRDFRYVENTVIAAKNSPLKNNKPTANQ